MTQVEIGKAIRKRFRQQVAQAESPDLVTEYDNLKLTAVQETVKQTRGKWARVHIAFDDRPQVSLGASKRFRAHGRVMVQIFTEVATGTQESDQLVDTIVNAFRATSSESVTYLSPEPDVIGDDDGKSKWWQVNIVCPFYADDVET
jgi:hypothetical protein